MIYIIIRDIRNKEFDTMNVDNYTESKITNNVSTLIKEGFDVNMQTIVADFSNNDLEQQGWKKVQSLYDKLIIEYNNNQNTKKLLI